MNIPLLDLKREYLYMKQDIDKAIQGCLEHQKWILGPEVNKLEEKVTEYMGGVKHCIGISSGTDALVLSLRALAIKYKGKEFFTENDKIITTPFTFTATGDAILRSGATPVFVDIDSKTFNIDPERILAYLAKVCHSEPCAEPRFSIDSESQSPNVIGILPVHLYGQSCEMDKIMEIAREYNLFVLEDVAQSFGGKWQDKKLGTIGNAGVFSFFPSKNLGGFGDGGMVATNDIEIAELVRIFLKHGGKDKYNVDHIGYNARLDTIQAAVLLAKIKYVDEFNEKRRKIAEFYNKELAGLDDIILPAQQFFHVYHQYTIRITNERRNDLQNYLKEKGIASALYYPLCLHQMKVFEGRCEIFEELENSEKMTEQVLSLPVEPLLKKEEMQYTTEAIKSFF